MTLPVPAASTWYTGDVGAPMIQQYFIDPINAVNTLAQHYRFWGNFNTSKSVVAGANANYDVIQDPSGGWSSSTKAWTCPVAGTYLVTFQFKWNSATTPTQATAYGQVLVNGGLALQSPNTSSPGAFGGIVFTGPLACAANDKISIQTGSNFTTQNDSPAGNNFLYIRWDGP